MAPEVLRNRSFLGVGVHKHQCEACREGHPEIKENVYKKDDELLSRLKEVYVDSTDPSSEVNQDGLSPKPEEFRSPKHTIQNSFLNLNVDNIPKGKISIIEVLTVLNNHKISPHTWTSEKTATEYSLDVKDAQAMLEYFKIFEMKIVKPEEKKEISDK
ncbi:NADH dehydrogenase [ubiquinone] 1 alpha subcomplex assembly factor 4 isoform X2 [Hyperolius riggenbachi]|uniref:NADH dehydrogenase [ubiquinone] 1 alpha subcomplex assembly factor 4 isoform X2 n=1 Tax=Hyperolius riggenbachi TaxID=752182 RepID=UPI0035A31151